MRVLIAIIFCLACFVVDAQILVTTALPKFNPDRHRQGTMIKLTTGGVYVSNGSDWAEIIAPGVAYAADGVTILGAGTPGDEFSNAWANVYSETAGDIAIQNTTASNIVRNLTTSADYYDGQMKFLRVVSTGNLTLAIEAGETYTINGVAGSLIMTTGQTAILQYSSDQDDWIAIGGSLLTKNASTASNQTFLMVNDATTVNYNQAGYTLISEWDNGTPLVTTAGFFTTSTWIAWTPTGGYLYEIEAHLRFNPSAADQRIEVAVEIDGIEQPVKWLTNTSVDGNDILHCTVRWQEEDGGFEPIQLKARLEGATGSVTLDAIGTSSFAVTRKKVND